MSKEHVFALLFLAACIGLVVAVSDKPAPDAVVGPCAVGEAAGPEGVCLSPYDGPFTPINSPPPPGFVLDSQPPDIVDPWKAQPGETIYLASPDAADQLNEQAMRDWERRRWQEEVSLAARRQQDALQSIEDEQYTAYSYEAVEPYRYSTESYEPPSRLQQEGIHDFQPTQATLIRHANSMPNVTAIQVAPDWIWDYSTGQYHQVDPLADGSLQERVGE